MKHFIGSCGTYRFPIWARDFLAVATINTVETVGDKGTSVFAESGPPKGIQSGQSGINTTMTRPAAMRDHQQTFLELHRSRGNPHAARAMNQNAMKTIRTPLQRHSWRGAVRKSKVLGLDDGGNTRKGSRRTSEAHGRLPM
jgi:hypothetical protein